MNKLGGIKGRPIAAALILAFTLSLLTACTLGGSSTICHATGDAANPYQAITVNSAALEGHRGHPNDMIPAPACGCPTDQGAAGLNATGLEATSLRATGSGTVSNGTIRIWHATGSKTVPYVEIMVSTIGLDGHDKHADDLIPAPVCDCPKRPEAEGPEATGDDTVTIWHATGSQPDPYIEITVSADGLDGHCNHVGDIIPAPKCDCPKNLGMTTGGKITICHATGSQTNPYTQITMSLDGLNGHDKHEGDIIPAPEGGCPTEPAVTGPANTSGGKITICHATGSQTNPYTQITVSLDGLNGHDKHEGDIIPAPEGGCPTEPAVTGPANTGGGKITICHATGSRTNPYTEITVSVNGLNGHGKHEGDIIPAPVGGCPTGPEDKGNNGKGKKEK